MSTRLIDIITIGSMLSALIPITIGWVRYKRASGVQRILTFLVSASFTADSIANALFYSSKNNLAVYNIYALISFNLIWLLYQKEIPRLKNWYVWSAQILINVFAFVNAFFIQSLNVFNSNLLVLISLTFLSLAVYSFYQLLKEIKHTRLEKNPIFWINTGIIIYYSGTLILFLLSNQIKSTSPNATALYLASWGLNSFFNLLLIISYSIALWVKPVK